MNPRYLGLDFGDRTIGVAVSCPRAKVATGVETLRRTDPNALKPAIARLREIIAHYQITHIILGNPLHMDGNPSDRSEKTSLFAEKLRRNFKRVPVLLWDERLSTQAVTRTLSDPQRIDEMAATYILQGYLDRINLPENEAKHMQQLTMLDENNNEQHFDILASKEKDGVLYLLAAADTNDDEAEIIHFKCADPAAEDLIFEPIDPEADEFDWMMHLFRDEYDELGVEIEE